MTGVLASGYEDYLQLPLVCGHRPSSTHSIFTHVTCTVSACASSKMSSGPTGEGAKPEAPKIVFKKRSRPASIRQKPVADDTVEEGAIKRIKPEAPRAPAQFSSKTTKEQVDRLKFNYEGTGEIQERGDSGATRVLETETAFDNDARAQRERFLAQGPAEDGQYKGQNNYKDWKAVRVLIAVATVVLQQTSCCAHGVFPTLLLPSCSNRLHTVLGFRPLRPL